MRCCSLPTRRRRFCHGAACRQIWLKRLQCVQPENLFLESYTFTAATGVNAHGQIGGYFSTGTAGPTEVFGFLATPTAKQALDLAKVEKTARQPGGYLYQWPTRVHRVPAEEGIAASTASLLCSGDGKAFTLLLLPRRVSWFCTAMQTVKLVDGIGLGQNFGLRQVKASKEDIQRVEVRLDRIENLLIEEQRRKIENLEMRMKKLEDALAV